MKREKLVQARLKTRAWTGCRTALLGMALALGLACTAAAGQDRAPTTPLSPAGTGATDPARLDPPRQGLELDFEDTLRRVKEEPASASRPLPSPAPDKDKAGPGTTQAAKGPVLDKVERDWGLRPFKKNGYRMLAEPRISFIKRKPDYSEVVEYSWQPLIIEKMPHHERIDRIRFSFNRYYFTGRERRIFYGGGLGGNIILFNHELKDWAVANNLSLKDGVNGLGRLFFGYKFSEFTFNKWTYPVVFRVDAIISPAYKFGGNLGEAGDRLELNEITAGLSLGIE